jgi:hypothetical protein
VLQVVSLKQILPEIPMWVAAHSGRRMLHALRSQPIDRGSVEPGVEIFPQWHDECFIVDTVETLLKHADTAMYHSRCAISDAALHWTISAPDALPWPA